MRDGSLSLSLSASLTLGLSFSERESLDLIFCFSRLTVLPKLEMETASSAFGMWLE